jgi:hypothetical protein
MLNQVQQDLQQHKISMGVGTWPDGSTRIAPIMLHGVPVEDAVEQVQIELQVVQSRSQSVAASIGGYVFGSYEVTLKWVFAHCSLEDWQYVMDLPVLYHLVRPDGQGYRVLLEEESYSIKAEYASSTKARLALAFKTKVPGIAGADLS